MRGIGRIIGALLVLALAGQSLLAPVSTADHEYPRSPDLDAVVSTGALCDTDDYLEGECTETEMLDIFYLWEVRYCLEVGDGPKDLTIIRAIGTEYAVEERTVYPDPEDECQVIQAYGELNGPACIELETFLSEEDRPPVPGVSQEDRDLECGVPTQKHGVKAPILSDR